MMLDFVEAPRPRSPAEFKWDDAAVDRMKTLWRQGLPATAIALDIGCSSRSAVLGRIHREQRKEFSADLVRRKPAHAPRKKSSGGQNGLNLNSPRPRVEPKVSDHAPDESKLCLLTELEYGMCRWPIDRDGQRWFCGAPQAEPDAPSRNYCAFHHRKSIQPARPAQSRGPFRLFK